MSVLGLAALGVMRPQPVDQGLCVAGQLVLVANEDVALAHAPGVGEFDQRQALAVLVAARRALGHDAHPDFI